MLAYPDGLLNGWCEYMYASKEGSSESTVCTSSTGTHARIQRGGGRGSGPPWKITQNIGFLSNTGPDPLKNHKATKPEFNVGSSSARPMIARLKWYLDPSSPHQLKKVKVGSPLTKLSGSAHGTCIVTSMTSGMIMISKLFSHFIDHQYNIKIIVDDRLFYSSSNVQLICFTRVCCKSRTETRHQYHKLCKTFSNSI